MEIQVKVGDLLYSKPRKSLATVIRLYQSNGGTKLLADLEMEEDGYVSDDWIMDDLYIINLGEDTAQNRLMARIKYSDGH